MRSSWPYLFAILLLISMSLCSACVLQPQENKTVVQNTSTSVNIGLRPIRESPVSPTVSLERARQMLGDGEQQVDMADYSRQEISYVQGRDLDAAGNAETWLFGIRSPMGNQLRVYDRNRWTAIPWNATLPSEEIRFDRILPLNELINRSRNEIEGTTGPNRIRVIELKNGIYLLTLTQGSTDRIVAFNATTGALIA